MDRELLIEIGCEELPAGWLPDLTREIGERVAARLAEHRLAVNAPVETFSTPRRLAVRIAKIAERQTDLEELITGPPVSAGFAPDGQPTPAAVGFARKQGVEVSALERVETSKGVYLAYRRRQHGKAAVDVLPDVFAGTLRDLTFPRPMRWDARLEDGKGELPFGRPIRWILFLYGGRVVPFAIRRGDLAQSPQVQDVRSAAVTYGHRFLTTSGRAGRAIKVRTFDEYRAKLLENFVFLERQERHDRIARELDAHARRLGGRLSPAASRGSSLLQEVPDLVEYPSVVAGTFAPEFLTLPEEVLTTTMIHHQHYFPITDDQGRLKPAFLAVTNIEAERPELIARNSERVLAARLRDARFFWDADRKVPLESRLERLETLLFHKKLGSYGEKARRIERLARWIAEHALGAPQAADRAATAARLAKTDLTTEMVQELTELQGTMGGIYAREEGQPEEIWKAIYYHYLPVAVESDAPPTRAQLGAAAVSWAAVSLADKLDSVFGLYAAGDRQPTSSRDPFGVRRQAAGVLKILMDLTETTGLRARVRLGTLFEKAREPFEHLKDQIGAQLGLYGFWHERLKSALEQRGYDPRNVRAVLAGPVIAHLRDRQLFTAESIEEISPKEAKGKLEILPEFTNSADFLQLATVFRRVRNIAKELPYPEFHKAEHVDPELGQLLKEPSEVALLGELNRRQPVIDQALAAEDYRRAFSEASRFGPGVHRFFTDVFVMVDDVALRRARLRLMRRVEDLILKLADISEIVPQAES